MKQVTLYTDGGCWPNPGGHGGYGAVLIYGEHYKELSAGYRSSTNNRMEIRAALAGLEALKEPCQVTVISDSEYLVKTMNGRYGMGKNKDLWDKLVKATKRHRVTWVWVRGHDGNEWNERCDELASRAMRSKEVLEDEGYGI